MAPSSTPSIGGPTSPRPTGCPGEFGGGWVLANPVVTSAIIDASRPEQLADSLTAAGQPLPAEAKALLDEATTKWPTGDASD